MYSGQKEQQEQRTSELNALRNGKKGNVSESRWRHGWTGGRKGGQMGR